MARVAANALAEPGKADSPVTAALTACECSPTSFQNRCWLRRSRPPKWNPFGRRLPGQRIVSIPMLCKGGARGGGGRCTARVRLNIPPFAKGATGCSKPQTAGKISPSPGSPESPPAASLHPIPLDVSP